MELTVMLGKGFKIRIRSRFLATVTVLVTYFEDGKPPYGAAFCIVWRGSVDLAVATVLAAVFVIAVLLVERCRQHA